MGWEPTSSTSKAQPDRRAFLQKSLVATGVAWTAPIVMSVSDPLAAATGSGGCPYTFCFDDGTTEGWIIDNTAGSGNGLWQVNNGRSTSPSFSLHYGTGVGGDYNTGGINSGTVTSPLFTVPAAGGNLTFNIWREVETFGSGTWDGFSVTVLPASTVIYQTGPDGGTGGVFEPVSLSLAAYAGTTIQLVLTFDTVDNNFNDFEGIWVDDITVPCDAAPGGAFIAGGGLGAGRIESYFPPKSEPTKRELKERRRATN